MSAGWLEFWLGGRPGAGGELRWMADGPTVAVAVALALAAFAVALWSGHGAERRGRAREALLWAGALILLVIAAARPVWVEEHPRQEPGRLAVLVDASASMGVLESGRPRGEAISAILDALPADAELFSFDEELRVGAPDPARGFVGRGTDLGVALDALADRFLGQRLRGVVLITDGLDRGQLRRTLREAPDAEIPALPGPLTIYQVGDATDLDDLAVDDVLTGGFGFLRTPFTLTARVRGEPGQRVPVTLTREGRLVGSETVELDRNGRGEVAFEVTPTSVGRFSWEVSVPTPDGDAVPGNNSWPVVIRVVRDRMRVLQVSGSPSFDEKFLRLFLKEDPSVDLVSFFILRTRTDFGAGWDPDELSLIEFPYDRLFSEDLGTFDLVILQNFNYRPYFEGRATELLENLAAYVREGGALVITGGDRSFDLGEYQNTALAAVLPLEMGLTGVKTDEARFRPSLTEAGAAHPITRLAGDRDESAAIWQRLPEMDGLNLTAGLKEDAAVLLEHPTVRLADGRPMPVLAVREVERGRTMALAVDASWRWSFSEAATGRGNQAYLRFWKNAMRWLVADPAERRVVVAPSRENVLLGDEVRLVVKVRDAGYAPVANAAVSVLVHGPTGEALRTTATTDSAGEAIVPFTPAERGAHRVEVSAGSAAGDRGDSVFAVSARDPELAEIVPDTAFLQALAARTGGAWRGPGDLAAPLLDDSAGREVVDHRETPLGDAPLLALLAGGLAGAAWWVRRRAGGR